MAHQNIIQFSARVMFITTPAVWELKPDGALSMHKVRDTPQRLDAWKTRKAFVSLRISQENPDDLLTFLNGVGVFAGRRGDPHPIDVEAAVQWQSLIAALLCTPFRKWQSVATAFPQYKEQELFLSDRFRMEFKVGSGLPEASLTGRTALEAILATIHLDQARSARFRVCARPDCRSEFELTSAHERSYCEQYCAHLESVRRLRLRRRSASLTTSHRKSLSTERATSN